MATQNAIGGGNFSFPQLTGVRYPRVFGSNLSTGDTDLYTVPAGKKCLILPNTRAYNPSAGSITAFGQIKVGGTYYRIGINGTLTAGTGGNNTGGPPQPIVLSAGEIWAINCATTSGLNVGFIAIEFDSWNSLSTARVLALSNGDNTIYTVPAGKTAITGAGSSLTNAIAVLNDSGGSLNYIYYCVPSGGGVGSTNQMYPSTAVADNANGSFQVSSTLSAGDFLVINASAGTATQTAYITYWEI